MKTFPSVISVAFSRLSDKAATMQEIDEDFAPRGEPDAPKRGKCFEVTGMHRHGKETD